MCVHVLRRVGGEGGGQVGIPLPQTPSLERCCVGTVCVCATLSSVFFFIMSTHTHKHTQMHVCAHMHTHTLGHNEYHGWELR